MKEIRGSKMVAQMLEKIIQLEDYATSEPITQAKKQYANVTQKIFYNKESLAIFNNFFLK